MPHDVFISYSHHDKTIADAVVARLEQAGHRCWIAPRDVPYGKSWADGIIDGIRGARIFILIYSDHANRSPQVLREIERAVSNDLVIIPFRIEDVPPSKSLEFFMAVPHWMDAITPPLQQHIERLSGEIGRLLSGDAAPTLPTTPAPAPPPKAPKRRRWLGPVGAGTAAGAVAVAAVGWLIIRPEGKARADEIVAGSPCPERWRRPQPSRETYGSAPGAASADEIRPLLDFNSVRTGGPPGFEQPAEAALQQAAVPMRINVVSPSAARVIFRNNRGLYDGNAVVPTTSQNFLTMEVPIKTQAYFIIEFRRPLAEFSFTTPRLFAATESGVTFPAFSARAYAQSGQALAAIEQPLVTRTLDNDVPAQTFTLRAPAFDGIRSVCFYSDPKWEEESPAAFRALLIERMGFRPWQPEPRR